MAVHLILLAAHNVPITAIYTNTILIWWQIVGFGVDMCDIERIFLWRADVTRKSRGRQPAQCVDVTAKELREALAASFPERSEREHARAARIMADELEAAMKYTAFLVVCGNDEVLADRLVAGQDPTNNGWRDAGDMAVRAATSILRRAGLDYRLETSFRAYNGGPRKSLIEVARWKAESDEGDCEVVAASDVPNADVKAVEEVIDQAHAAMEREMRDQVAAEESRRAALEMEEAD